MSKKAPAEFTPVPWVIFRTKFSSSLGIDRDGGESVVLWQGGVTGETPENTEANARLIADAPAMYELLKRIADHFNSEAVRYKGPMDLDALKEAQELLARHQP